MDAQAHLLSLGWMGPGHALDSRPPPPTPTPPTSSLSLSNGSTPTYKQKGHRGLAYDPMKVGNTGQGLVKPLPINRRKDRLGIGKKAHEPSRGNEWWLKGFESALGNVGKDEMQRKEDEKNGGGGSRVLMGRAGEKYGGLYGFFCRGVVMEGTMSEAFTKSLSKSSNSKAVNRLTNGKKRKSDVLDENGDDDTTTSTSTFSENASNDRTERKSKKQKRKNGLEVSPVRRPAETAQDFGVVGAFLNERDRHEKRKKREPKTDEIQQFQQIGEFFSQKDKDRDRKKNKKRKSEVLHESVGNDGDEVNGISEKIETKEERRERRRKRREEKELRRQLKEEAGFSQDKTNGLNGHEVNGESGMVNGDEEAARKARRAERKRRKATPIEKEM